MPSLAALLIFPRQFSTRQFSIKNFGWLSDAPCVSVCVCVCVRNCMRRPESVTQIFFIFCMKLTYDDTTKTDISNLKKSNMAAVITKIIDNLQLKYRKVCAGWNQLGRSFSFFTWNLLIMMQQKPILNFFKKSNMPQL